jgi:uncharacterized protein (DUF427 family)
MSSGPGYKTHPEHHIELKKNASRVRVEVDGEVIAETADAITLEEDGYGPIYYVPRSDVKMDRLVPTARHTRCPFKGEASYFSVKGKGRVREDAVWTYEQPYDEVASIKGRLAFYADKVDAIQVS